MALARAFLYSVGTSRSDVEFEVAVVVAVLPAVAAEAAELFDETVASFCCEVAELASAEVELDCVGVAVLDAVSEEVDEEDVLVPFPPWPAIAMTTMTTTTQNQGFLYSGFFLVFVWGSVAFTSGIAFPSFGRLLVASI